MRFLTTSVAIIAILGASTGAWGQEGEGLRDALTEAQAAGADVPAPAFDEAAAMPVEVEAPLEAEELDQLLAPIALYPDALLAQVLVAAAYPLQVVKADQLINASEEMSEDEMAAEIERQDLDPSVLVLMSGFPTVVGRMAEDIDWTERLGNAMLAQDEDVLASVQRLRAEADAAGNLTSNAAQVVEEDAGQISIRPADPDVVYVPSYNPVTTYTTPNVAYAPSNAGTGTSLLANPLVAGALAFGGALLVQQLFDDDDDHDGNRDGWGNYWQDSRPIDWRQRQVYPRGGNGRHGNDRAWSQERDRYWDADRRHWSDDHERSAGRHELQRALFGETVAPAPTRERMRAAARERAAVREAAPEDKAATGRRAERVKAAARRDERAKAVAARDERVRKTERAKAAGKPAAEAERAKGKVQKPKARKAAAKPEVTKVEAVKPKVSKAEARPKVKQAEAAKPKVKQAEAAKPKVRKAEAKPKVKQAEAAKPKVRKAEAKPKVKQAEAAKPKVRKAEAKPKAKQAEAAKPKVRKAEAKPKAKQAEAAKPKVRKAEAKPAGEKAARNAKGRKAAAREQKAVAQAKAPKAVAPVKAEKAKQKPAKAQKQAQAGKRKKCDPKKQDCKRK